MLLRGVAVLAMALPLTSAAIASEKPTSIRRLSCTLVRFYVAKYSESAAESWARGHGATEAEIAAARRCLEGVTVQTAGLAVR